MLRAPRTWWLGLAAISVLVLLRQVLPFLETKGTSFPGYWVVARAILDGVPVAQLYDPGWLVPHMEAQGFVGDRMFGPPTLVLTLMPLAWLPYGVARAVWMLGVLWPALMLSLAWLLRPLGLRGLALLALLALGMPVAENMAVGQIYPVMLALHCLGLWAWDRGKTLHGGLALAPMIALRGWYGLPQAVGWAVGGRWRALLVAGAATLALIALSLPLVGTAAWEIFLTEQVPASRGDPAAMSLAYQTWRSLALHLTTLHPQYSPDPPLRFLGSWLWLTGAALIGGLSLWAGRRAQPGTDGGLGFALWTATALLLAPVAEDHHMVLALLPLAVLARNARWLPVLVSLPLLLVGWEFDRPTLLGGWRSIAAYPRVWGLAVVWWGCIAALMEWRLPAFPSRKRREHVTLGATILPLLLLACGGGEPCPGDPSPERDRCLLEAVARESQTDPAAALARARSITDPAGRDSALLAVLEGGGLSEPQARSLCAADFQTTSAQAQCEAWVARPHLHQDKGTSASKTDPGPLGPVDPACAGQASPDRCLADLALARGRTDPQGVEAALAGIGEAALRGHSLAAVARAQPPPTSLDELRAFRPLLSLAEGQARDEAATVLGSVLPFQLALACTDTPATCDAQLDTAVLPFAAETCGMAGGFTGQCFDHICSELARLAVHRSADPTDLPTQLQAFHARGLAIDSRVSGMPGCAPLWAGRVLVQSPSTGPEADRWCAALPADQAHRCLSGAAEGRLVGALRHQPVADAEALMDRLEETGPDSLQAAMAPGIRPYLPCAGFSVLQHRLVSGLDPGTVPTARLRALRDAHPQCAWSQEEPFGRR